jgi:hypothetical protein
MTETPHTVVDMPILSPRRPTIETDSTTMAPPGRFVSRKKRAAAGTKEDAEECEGGTQFEMDELEMMIGGWENPC